MVAGINFMQNLPLRCLPVQKMFYLRKLRQLFFCVLSLGNGKAVFYTYHKDQGNKRPNEVCTFINDCK